MYLSRFRLVAAGALIAGAFSVVGAGTAYAVQAHMVNARNDLQQSLFELQRAEPDKGGHRDQAINLVEQAINQVDQGIQFADGN